MLGPDWQEGCPSYSLIADHIDGSVAHLAARDEERLKFGMAWVRHHDKYDEGYCVDTAADYVAPPKAKCSSHTSSLT